MLLGLAMGPRQTFVDVKSNHYEFQQRLIVGTKISIWANARATPTTNILAFENMSMNFQEKAFSNHWL